MVVPAKPKARTSNRKQKCGHSVAPVAGPRRKAEVPPQISARQNAVLHRDKPGEQGAPMTVSVLRADDGVRPARR